VTVKAPNAGEPISSSQWLKPVARELNQLTGPKAPGAAPPAAQAVAPLIESGVILAEQSNTITVLTDREGATLTVAKPPSLRGNIGTRQNSDDETEEIFPAYHPGVRVLIGQVASTGVAGVEWADLQWDSRRWTIEV
jgi:hypothetical protein